MYESRKDPTVTICQRLSSTYLSRILVYTCNREFLNLRKRQVAQHSNSDNASGSSPVKLDERKKLGARRTRALNVIKSIPCIQYACKIFTRSTRSCTILTAEKKHRFAARGTAFINIYAKTGICPIHVPR